ncbi:MAG: P-loop NTPase [Candidatus Odinarchaeia archaeon]
MNFSLEMNQTKKIRRQLDKIKHKIAIMGIKGGIGKSTITANLAVAFSQKKMRVGVLDADINNPCIPKIFNIQDTKPIKISHKFFPVKGPYNINIVATNFFIPEEPITFIRGGSKIEIMRFFLSDVQWGDLDYLLIDFPPSIGSEFLAILQFIPELDGVILVSTPNSLSCSSITKTAKLLRQSNLNILGLIGNMSDYMCPNCNESTNIFGRIKFAKIAKNMGIPFLGEVPFLNELGKIGESCSFFENLDSHINLKNIFLKISDKIINSS